MFDKFTKEIKHHYPKRIVVRHHMGVSTRWKAIQEEINKYWAFYNNVISIKVSGVEATEAMTDKEVIYIFKNKYIYT